MNKERRGKEVAGLEGRVLVDGFKYADKQVEAFFLSHFHGDHYDGLSENFDGPGRIYCTKTTGDLVVQELKVRKELVVCYEYGESAHVCGAKVTFLDANHCPGAALLLFELEDGTVHLHTGDMRYDKKMKEYPELVCRRGLIDRVYLDTTYCHPKHVFPGQDKSIDIIASDQEAIDGAQENRDGDDPSRRLVLLSAYKIGKERVICEVARRAKAKVYVDEAKMRVMRCLRMSEEDLSVFTCNMRESQIHICRMGFAGDIWPFFRPNFVNIERYIKDNDLPFTSCMAFIPTGWADSSNYNKKNSLQFKGNFSVKCVPYSEHSNYNELVEFVEFLRPRNVFPTVFTDEKVRRGGGIACWFSLYLLRHAGQ
ncbi:hypothetical protein GUITHDRAFT_65538 [Guillardia theta CCMP2712]|uniref:Metallo-beta-lactamase domain-containing protein n=1 Tax=Guillardia theta (strain CCMP2712) TaxID=905079 RepID=L1JUN8_GUITC|nr:hypothetical protein GUITHDRAFT_65538 [Guillardia theta CCMP2712]EKX52039.1 hypothetical protein GUITHDRAFT_65538 [Guillardia theta CCMP2712]|eukprot:XP_005839019.1 hypothetical protein GUITHDRAFT_65538 [Guillardia theta CCMP2712]